MDIFECYFVQHLVAVNRPNSVKYIFGCRVAYNNMG